MAPRKKKTKEEDTGPASLASLLGMDEIVPPVVEEIVKPTKLSPFDFINAITFNKTNLITDDVTEKQYLPFMVNRGLSNSMDTVLYANEMNRHSHMDKKMQFTFLLHTVVKRKRYDKWAKKEVVENLEMVKEFYGFSDEKALTALSILTEDQLTAIRKKLDKGGLK